MILEPKNNQTPDEHFVYHGSHEFFDVVMPKRQIRKSKNPDGEGYTTVFDEISFHATPYRWIALAYTNQQKTFEVGGIKYHYTMGVDLKKYSEEIEIYGYGSLEESLVQLYGDGGYLFKFMKEQFFYMKGLGALEVIVKDSIVPLSVERINDPVSELKKLGIKFTFIDLTTSDDDFSKMMRSNSGK